MNFQTTHVVFEKEKDQFQVRVVKQILWVNGMRYELQEIYGIGNSVDGDFDGNDPVKLALEDHPRFATVHYHRLACHFGVCITFLLHLLRDKSGESVGDSFSNFIQGMMSVPLDIPGTTFHKCLKNQKKVVDMMRKEMQERKANPEIRKGDFLDHITRDMNKEKFLTENFIVCTLFVILLASFESISSTLTVALMSLTEHPTLVQELMEEHEAILTSRGDADSGVTWDEYKSMTFTHHVISESLRLGNAGPGLMRRAVRDIPINGYTIPKGWAIMVVSSAIQLNPDNYEDPLVFNPWRWKHIRQSVAAKRFIPFGGGSIMCPGAEFSKILMAMFLHKLVTKYRWTKLKGGEVVRTPLLTFGDGFHIQVYEKE